MPANQSLWFGDLRYICRCYCDDWIKFSEVLKRLQKEVEMILEGYEPKRADLKVVGIKKARLLLICEQETGLNKCPLVADTSAPLQVPGRGLGGDFAEILFRA